MSAEDRCERRHDLFRLPQAAHAEVPAGQAAFGRLEHVHAPPAQHRDVVLHRRVLPHLGVHGRADQHRGTSGEQGSAQQVGRNTRRVAADQAGGGGRHHYRIGVPAELDVRDNIAAPCRPERPRRPGPRRPGPGSRRPQEPVVAEQGSPSRLGRKGAKSERPDKTSRALCQDRAHESPRVA